MGREQHPAGHSVSSNSQNYLSFSSRLLTALSGKFYNRSILITEAGFVGISAPQIKSGDIIAVVYGAAAPLVLHPYLGNYRMVGCAYVSGLMGSELWDSYYTKCLLPIEQFNIH